MRMRADKEATRPVPSDEAGNGHELAPADWPARPACFPDLMTPIEAAQYLRLDELGSHTPQSAIRTLNYWRDKAQLKATRLCPFGKLA